MYSNQPEITLLVNGRAVTTQAGSHVFVFLEVALREGPNTITARCSGLEDTITLNGVAQPNPDYVLPERDEGRQGVANWFEDIQVSGEMEYPAGAFSVKDQLKDILDDPDAADIFWKVAEKALGARARSLDNMLGMVGGMTLEQVMELSGVRPGGRELLYLNQQLNKIRKAEP